MTMARRVTILIVAAFLGSCTRIGVTSIVAERQDYNEAINYTSTQQTMANIVRSYNRESPTFLNVSDITSSKSLGANLSGGSSNIGAMLPIGSLSSMFSANDQPIVKYTATTGYDLISQISDPISINDIFKLTSSNSPLLPLLVFSTNRFTPEFGDYFRAIAIINALDTLGAITMQQADDGVVSIKFDERGFVSKAVSDNREDANIACFNSVSSSGLARGLWAQLLSIYKQRSRNEILLFAGLTKRRETYIVTRSALGALSVSGNDHDIAFLPEIEINRIILENKQQDNCLQDFYFMGRGDLGVAELWSSYYRLMASNEPSAQAQFEFRKLAGQRALILIQTTNHPVYGAFASYERNGVWYSIRDDDRISKRNFSLLNTLLTIQAVPAAQPTPTLTSIQLRN